MPVPFEYQKTQSVIRPRIPIESGYGSPIYVDDQDQLQNSDPPAIDPSLVGAWQPYQPPVDDQQPGQGWKSVSASPTQNPTQAQALSPSTAIPPADIQPPVANPPSVNTGPVDSSATGPAPLMVPKDKRGRPNVDSIIGDGSDVDKAQTGLSAIKAYQPQNAHGWRRYILPLLAGWAAGQRSAKPGPGSWAAGLGGAITGAITGQVQPDYADRQWKAAHEAEAGDNLDTALKQAKGQAEIDNIGSLQSSRDQMAQMRATRDKRQTDHEQYVQKNGAIQTLLRQYQSQGSYNPNADSERNDPNSLTRRAAALGVVLQPKNAAQKPGFTFDGYRWMQGPDGKWSPLKDDQGNILQDATAQDRLDEVNRHNLVNEAQGQTRNKIAQARLDLSKANGGSLGQFKSQWNGAKQAVNRFNDLTRRATEAASWGDAQSATNSKALLLERDQLEQQIKDQYGDLVNLDEKGKPSALRPRWSVSQFKTTHSGANIQQAQQQAQSDGAIIVP